MTFISAASFSLDPLIDHELGAVLHGAVVLAPVGEADVPRGADGGIEPGAGAGGDFAACRDLPLSVRA